MGVGRLTIDLDAVCANWRALDALSGGTVETAAVVKADGYGLDAARVAAALAAAGARSFFVAAAEEGASVRAAVGPGPDIFVFSGHMKGDAPVLRDNGLFPLLNSPQQVKRHASALPGHPFGLQIDSGMNRLGIEPEDLAALDLDHMPSRPVLVMSHLACADEPGHPMNGRQLRAFRAATDGRGWRRSLAATGGVLLGPDYHFDLTRPGIGLYGGAPFADAAPAVTLELPVIQTRTVRKGETVGYGNAWTAPRGSIIATLAAGYADGLIRALGGGATLWAGDTPCPLAGRVSMDLLTVDVTDLAAVPEALTIIGPRQGIDVLAEAAGTIGYEILTSLGRRYERVYKGA